MWRITADKWFLLNNLKIYVVVPYTIMPQIGHLQTIFKI